MKYIIVLIALFIAKANAQSVPTAVAPTAPYIEVNYLHRIISQTENQSSEQCPLITTDINEEDGYEMEVQKAFSGNFSINNSWFYSGPGIGLVAGIGPTASRYVLFMGKALGDDAIKNFKQRNLPTKKEELEAWNEKDAVFWNTEGGVFLTFGASYSVLSVAQQINVRGSWAHYVEKTGENSVFVSLINRRVLEASTGAGVSLVGASLQFVKEKSKSKSYEINLVDDEHFEAYKRFLRGNDDQLEALIAKGSENVEEIETINGKKSRSGWNFGAGVPIFPILSFGFSGQKERSTEEGEYSWGSSRVKTWGKYNWEARYRAVHLDYYRKRIFSAGVERKNTINWETGETEPSDHYFLDLEYHFEADHGRERRVKNQLKKFRKATGLYEYCAKVPDFDESLKYHQVKFEANFSEKFFQKIVQKDTDHIIAKIEDRIQSSAKEMIDLDKKLACGKKKNCLKKIVAKAKRRLKRIKKHLAKIKDFGFEDYKKSKPIAKIGKLITHNPVLYRTFINLGKSCGLKTQFELSGQKITKIKRDETFDETSSCLE